MSDITRKEKYYSAIISGGAVPEPITREEQYLAQMAQGGGGGGGASVYIGASTNPPAVPAEGMLWVVEDDDTLDVPNGDNLSY